MSSLKNARIKSYIEQHFTSLIDVSSVNTADRPMALLTRGLAALSVISFTGCEPKDAAGAVVDGGGDYGIDAIYFDTYTNTVYFSQSKWSNDGNKTIDEAAAHKLKYGVQKLLDLDFSGCNDKIIQKKEILENITKDAKVKIVLCVTYNSNNNLSESVKKILDDYIESVNVGDDIMQLGIAGQNKVYDVASRSRGPVNEDIAIKNWMQVLGEKTMYYGQVAASDLASLFDSHQDALFTPNIRAFKGDTDVNNLIVESLIANQDIFCFLNNGITAIANEIVKKPLGGNSRELGIFECKGFAVVNGAQTVGACNRAFKLDDNKTRSAYVMIKIIETGQPDNELAVSITKAANTQNKIERKDFVALDPYQKELKEGLDTLGVRYVYKTGEPVPEGGAYFDLSQVTQALIADLGDISLIATAKREIGKIWDDIGKAPYKILFNSSNNAYYVKHIVELFSAIQDSIRTAAGGNSRKIQYTVHGNVFVAAQCLKKINKDKIKTDGYGKLTALEQVRINAPQIFDQIYSRLEGKYPGSYLAHLFRNAAKLTELDAEMSQ